MDTTQVFQKDAVCPKCGSDGIAARWCKGRHQRPKALAGVSLPCQDILKREGIDVFRDKNHPLVKMASEEHMERICPCCHYSWLELPLDKAHALEQLAAQATTDG